MQFEDLGEAVLSWMEALRSWLLQQSWLDFARGWITTVEGSTMWAILVVSVAGLILLIGFWPGGQARAAAAPAPQKADIQGGAAQPAAALPSQNEEAPPA